MEVQYTETLGIQTETLMSFCVMILQVLQLFCSVQYYSKEEWMYVFKHTMKKAKDWLSGYEQKCHINKCI